MVFADLPTNNYKIFINLAGIIVEKVNIIYYLFL